MKRYEKTTDLSAAKPPDFALLVLWIDLQVELPSSFSFGIFLYNNKAIEVFY